MAKSGTEAKWLGGERPTCDMCRYTFGKEGVPALYDARLRGRTTWGNLCESCFQEFGIGLGTDKGQRLVFETTK